MRKEINVEFDADSENESLARVIIGAFMTSLNPTMEEIQDVQTAVSEAVTNAIIHGYREKTGKIRMYGVLEVDRVKIDIIDEGIGIADISLAMQPLYSSCPEEERSGMGFSFMEAFMDQVQVESVVGKGTVVHMEKKMQSGKKLVSFIADQNYLQN